MQLPPTHETNKHNVSHLCPQRFWGATSFCMICLLYPISSIAQVDNDLTKSEPFVVKLENPSFSTVHATIDIGSVQRGKTTTIPLRFENMLDSDNQKLYSVAYDSERLASGKELTLSLPVIASQDVDLSEVVVSTSGALHSEAGKHITAEYKPVVDEPPVKNAVGVVVVRIDPEALNSESEYLTVNITGKHFEPQIAQIVLRKKLPISLIPETLFFSSTDLENIQAFGFIRVGEGLDASKMTLISVKLESGEEIDATLNTSSSKVAKLDLVCSKENASHWARATKNLEIIVECGGKKYPINARCSFP